MRCDKERKEWAARKVRVTSLLIHNKSSNARAAPSPGRPVLQLLQKGCLVNHFETQIVFFATPRAFSKSTTGRDRIRAMQSDEAMAHMRRVRTTQDFARAKASPFLRSLHADNFKLPCSVMRPMLMQCYRSGRYPRRRIGVRYLSRLPS